MRSSADKLSITCLSLLTALGCGCSPSAAPEAPALGSAALFREVGAQSGLEFGHFIGATGDYFLPEIMGAGVALLDYDGDGDLDVFLPQGTLLDPSKSLDDTVFPPPTSNWPGGQLYRNEIIPNGELWFVNVTEQSGIRQLGYGMGAAVGDYDNDGAPDLFITQFGPNILYRNQGDGTFRDVTTAGLDDERWSASAAFCDYDRDGDLDLFFTNYVDFTVSNNKQCYDRTGARDYCTPKAYSPVPDRLFRNDAGTFVDASRQAGVDAAYGNGLGVACADFDGDGWTDIYVANDAMANQLWRNNQRGGFTDIALEAGVAFNADGLAEAGMGIAAGDFDADGDEDLFVTHLSMETNTLYLNNGAGLFRDETNRFGLGAVSTPLTGFGVSWFDFDHDGDLDLFAANGGVTIMESQRGSTYPFRQPNRLYRNNGGRFEDVVDAMAAETQTELVHRGAAFGDIDRDGDIDIVVSVNNGPARLLLNQHDAADWLQVRLTGASSNRDAIGARVALLTEGSAPMWRRVHTDGSYLSASSKTVHFGIPQAVGIAGVGVVWPDGHREQFATAPGAVVEIQQSQGSPWPADH